MCGSMDSVLVDMEADGIVRTVFGCLMVMKASFVALANLSEEIGKLKVQSNIAKDNMSSYRTTYIVQSLGASSQGQKQCVRGVAKMLPTADITNRPSGADQDDSKEP
ncbi:hypothetical protein COCMIDRAFT_33817 [Bipolaris oryzae ATCC 44560]|uniref:Uncharacterized protein n=1 Tax=Bipolaris oryzae ATCC 44560 TaxID=930090 RepID=W6ZFT8_COCMI|nr:uncharacterized protein COCMIDRAFT_33817 [Bipolaris oryzae ATCC 44560]EUC48743.1 hypothetical protein COCMIDRAFT_33817 [Bipolaris oryzae ATCC 44560]